MCFYSIEVREKIVDCGLVGALRLREPAFAVVDAQNTAFMSRADGN